MKQSDVDRVRNIDAAETKRARKNAKRLRDAGKPAVIGKLYADGRELGLIHSIAITESA